MKNKTDANIVFLFPDSTQVSLDVGDGTGSKFSHFTTTGNALETRLKKRRVKKRKDKNTLYFIGMKLAVRQLTVS